MTSESTRSHSGAGFSYPLEDGDCSARSNSVAAMSADFARMKRDFNATIVRVLNGLVTVIT